MPFPNFHSARLIRPGRFQDFRRSNDQFGTGIDAIFGIRMQEGERVSELQAIRFDKDRFTVAQARAWLKDHEFEPVLFEPATEPMREASHQRPLNPDGTCPSGFRKIRNQRGQMHCVRRMSEAIVPSGIHDHPHEPNGLHDHLGLPPATGGHRHELSPGSGAHSHREGDPLEGFHLGDPADEGAHVHILAQKEAVPELFKWYESVVDAHWPNHVWLPNHVATWIAVRLEGDDFSEPRQTTREDWQIHCLWSFHSPGANLQQHLAVHLDPMTRFLRLWYEFEDGNMLEATADDFRAEVEWLDSNLPFPDALVREALGAPAASQMT